MGRKANILEVVECCENRFGRGNASQWSHGDFVDLHQSILVETQANISINTLKRIFGKLSVDKNYIPQKATMEALQLYGRYSASESNTVKSETTFGAHLHSIFSGWGISRYFTTMSIMLVLGQTCWCYFSSDEKIQGNISIKKTEGILPLTAIFMLDLPRSGDSLWVDFGDKTPMISIRSDQKLIAHNYIFSGVFKVSLLLGQHLIAQTSISVSSINWIGLGYHDQMRNHYYEIPIVKTRIDSFFRLTNNQLAKGGLDTTQRIFTRLYNYSKINYSKDDFTFEASFRNPLRKSGIYCNSTQFQISGINSMIRFKLSSPGCSSRVLNVLSEQRYEGHKEDLSGFVLEQENWNIVRLTNRNKKVALFVNGKLLFSGRYQKPLGEIKGLFIEFEGDGIVKTCDLKAIDGRLLYHF